MKRLILFISVFFIFHTGFCQSGKGYLRNGNKKYENRKYAEAEVDYRKAISEDSTYHKGIYNLASSLYKQKQFKEANLYFQRLVNNPDLDKQIRANSFYGMGNSYLQQALQEYGKDDNSALKNLKESIESYKNTLRLNPNDTAAKYNLAFAQKYLPKPQDNKDNKNNKQQKEQDKKEEDKDKEDKNKKPQDNQNQDNKQNKDKQEQNKDKQNKDNQQKGGNNQQQQDQVKNSWQNQQQQQKGNQGDKQEDKQNEKQKPDNTEQGDKNKDQQGDKKQAQTQNPGEQQGKEGKEQNNAQGIKDIKKGEAERILEALKNNEKRTLEKNIIKVQGKQTDKDW